MEIDDLSNDELIAEIKVRGLEKEFEVEVEIEPDFDIGDVDTDELLTECKERGLYVSSNDSFMDLDLTSMFADGIWNNLAEIVRNHGEQQLHELLECFINSKIPIK
jgi:hypothetical protein